MTRIPRDIAVQLYRRSPEGPRFLMLRRVPDRGGFWQCVTGAPLPGESDEDAAVREVREETGFDVRGSLVDLGAPYSHALRPEAAARWAALYGPGVTSIPVVSFGGEVAGGREPALDGVEHDAFAWCTHAEARARLDWPIEADALPGRLRALAALVGLIEREGSEPERSPGAPDT
jgi:lipoyl(octanoyl) transferase